MLPKNHIIFGLIVSIILFLLFNISPFESFIIFFSSVFIDFDHYLWYVYNKKCFKINGSYIWFKERREKYLKFSKAERIKYKKPYFIFHSIEFLLMLLVLSYLNKIFLFVIIGIFLHLILDYVEIITLKEKLYSKFSLIVIYLCNKKNINQFFFE